MLIAIPESRTVMRAIEIQCASKISFLDASIVAAAEQTECEAIFSEDLNPGQYYAGIPVRNPFAEE